MFSYYKMGFATTVFISRRGRHKSLARLIVRAFQAPFKPPYTILPARLPPDLAEISSTIRLTEIVKLAIAIAGHIEA